MTPRVGLTVSGVLEPAYYDPYERALEAAGAEVVRIRPGEWSPGGLAGLVIPGGADIDPSRYGAARDPRCGDSDAALDELEIQAVRDAVESGLPVLGICRGQQVVNVALGGTLLQHIDGHEFRPPEYPRDHIAHALRAESRSHLVAATGGVLGVNSRHHQAVDRVAPDLRVVAWSPDGIVEAMESPDGRVLAVQSHPENLAAGHDWARALFREFVKSLAP